MKNLPIKAFSGTIQNQSTQLINARDLHQFLQVGRDFSNWIKSRIDGYNFVENEDFTCSPNLASGENQGLSRFWGGNNKIEYHLTLDMAKELCMLERSELGQQARRYFIQMEKEARASRQILADLRPAPTIDEINISKDRYIELLENENRTLRREPLPVAKRKPNIPLTMAEKTQILQLSQQGYSKSQIAEQINRSTSAVRAVIREA